MIEIEDRHRELLRTLAGAEVQFVLVRTRGLWDHGAQLIAEYRERWSVPEMVHCSAHPGRSASRRQLIARRSISNWSVCADSLLERASLVHRRVAGVDRTRRVASRGWRPTLSPLRG
ncbi:MAG TPA: hypothetical protein VIJ66_08620 [Solirubrobacteraceae bacterium]